VSDSDELTVLKKENKRLLRQVKELEFAVNSFKQSTVFQKNIYEMIKRQKSRQDLFLQLFLEYSPDIVFILDSNRRIILGTRNALNGIGIFVDDFTGKLLEEISPDIMPAEDYLRIDNAVTSVLENGKIVWHDEYESVINDKTFFFEFFTVPMKDENGEIVGVMLTFHNITDIHSALQAAERSNRAKTNFLAKMSHEIRTPMNAIIGMSELILRDEITKETRERVNEIRHAGGNLLSIINDILDFSKIESGVMEILPVNYNFSALITDVIGIIRMRLIEKPILFAVNVDCNIPDALIGDEVRIKQMLLNLLSNSCKYCEKGAITLKITHEFIDSNTVMLFFEVTDTGIGIKEEDAGKLFDDFVQVDRIRNKSVEGTGLGLAITRSFCRAMGGDIYFTSVYGEGSTFKIKVPQKFFDIDDYIPFARIEDTGKDKTALIYETREVYAASVCASMENLGIKHRLVTSQSKFLEEAENGDYTIFFISSFMFDMVGKMVRKLEREVKLILLAEYGQISIENDMAKTLFMPAHAADIAGIFNNRLKDDDYQSKRRGARFIAPTARVLVVDDITTNLMVAEGLMSPYKMKVDLCSSAKEAIDAVIANDYDIVFMDHMMPEMDGVEATLKIRSLKVGEKSKRHGEYYMQLPIVALTANAVSGMKEMFLENGFQDFIAKPIDINKLDIILDNLLPQSKREAYVESKEAAAESPAFKIEGIDVKSGIYMTGGSAKNYLKTLGIFRDDSIKKTAILRTCLESGDMPLYATHVHALKSAAASIGAARVSNLARSLEAAAKNGDREFVSKNTERFIEELNLLLESIRLAVATVLKDKKQTGKIDADTVKKRAGELKDALGSLDMEKVDSSVAELRSETNETEFENLVEEISNNILICEYDKAEELTDQLLENVK